MQQKKSERPQLFLSLSFQSLSCGAVSKEEGQSIIFPLKAGSRGGGEVGRREGLASAVCLLARCPPRSLYVVKLQCLSSHPQQRDQTVFKYADQNPADWNFTWSKGRRDACKTEGFLYTQKIWMSKSVTLYV